MKTRPLALTLLALSGLLTSGVGGCSGSDDSALFSAVPPGEEQGTCRSDGSCDAGLVCRSNRCVDPEQIQGASGSKSANTGGSSNNSSAGNVNAKGGNDVPAGGSAGTAGANTDAGTDSAGGSPEIDGGANAGGANAGGAGGAGVECVGVHPLVADKARYCAAGSCYCNAPFDTCFPAGTAQACCENSPLCGDNPSDRGVVCLGTHPITEPKRTCNSGDCFCSDGAAKNWDVCLPKAVASFCCPPNVKLTCIE